MSEIIICEVPPFIIQDMPMFFYLAVFHEHCFIKANSYSCWEPVGFFFVDANSG